MKVKVKLRTIIPRTPCLDCGHPSYTLYCDRCAADLAAPARFRENDGPTMAADVSQRHNGHPILHPRAMPRSTE